MKYFVFIICFVLSVNTSKAIEYGKLHKCGGIAGGRVSFDQESNAWFGCETGLYKIPNGSDSLIKIEEFRNDSQVVKIDYNRVFHEGSPSIFFAGDNKILTTQNEFYLIKKNNIIRIDTLRDSLQFPILHSCNTFDNKTFWMHIAATPYGAIAYKGLYHLDPDKLTWERFSWNSDGRGYPAVGLNYFHLVKHKDYYWYPGSYNDLTFFNKDTAGILYLKPLMQDSVAFHYRRAGWFAGDTYYFTGYDNKLYTYNLDSGELTEEDLTKTRIYTENEELINFDDMSMIKLACATDKFQILKIHSEGPGLKKWYFKKTGDSVYHNLDIDTNRITGFSRIFHQKDGIFWLSVGYDNEETNRNELGLMKIDLLAPGTSVESTEALPTVQPTRLYPNPTSKNATVRFFLNPNYRNKVKFEVYDYMGRKIKELDSSYNYDSQTAFGTKDINVIGLHTGAYYLVIDNGNEKRSIGFLVE